MISFFLGLGHTIIGILKKGNGEIYFIMAGVLFLITASYAFVVFKFGRRFCSFDSDGITFKDRYFKAQHRLSWYEISHIIFDGPHTVISKYAPPAAVYRIRAPLEKYEFVRKYFREYASEHNIPISE